MTVQEDNSREIKILLRKNKKAALVSSLIMAVLTAFTAFFALSPYNLGLIGVLLATVYLFVFIKFSAVRCELKDIGYKRAWLTVFGVFLPVMYVLFLMLCIIGMI